MTSCLKLEDAVTGQALGFSRREEKALDAVDCAADEMRQLGESWKNWETIQRHTIAENYAEGRLSLICDLNISVPEAGSDRDHWVNCCPLLNNKVFASVVYAADVPNVRHIFLSNQEPVLVFDVESVESPKGFSRPSLVRLYRIHDEVEDCFGGLLFQSTIDSSYKFVLGRADGEMSVRVPFLGSVKFNIAHRKIERASEIMDSVADNEQDILWRGLIHTDLEKAIASLRIVLHQNAVRISLGELSPLQMEIVDVLIGPLDL